MATTTPNFGFDVPTSTDYVKDGATAIETLGDDIDDKFGDVTNFPNQLTVKSAADGVRRPVAYSIFMGALQFNAGGMGVTFPTNRFTQAPVCVGTPVSTSGAMGVTVGNSSAGGVIFYSTTIPTGGFCTFICIQANQASGSG